ncbi:hypothetical protein [Pseudomonas fluorescens]|uniref:hypothetical protein n=1 Tax=Pseudomonas fluorescens TaxID=294 RepID=UPI0012418448|nr:hypothetical protein [Pseudomonas fluorescens]CAG8870718.1 hypothetical protein PS861_03655 [Pseudomonas fluorescens]VVQ24635.1 hypothetical protein PS934_05737 [Pseudomonas fluorescens]
MKFKQKDQAEYIPLSILWSKRFGLFLNIKYLALEAIFAKQIIQLMSNTSSVAEEDKIGGFRDASKGNNGTIIGQVSGVEKFIPSSLMTKFAEHALVGLLVNKYAGHYKFLIKSDGTVYCPTNIEEEDDVSETLFRVNKEMSHQLVSYVGKIDFLFLSLETLSVTASWLLTNKVEVALLVAGVFEFIRRFKI